MSENRYIEYLPDSITLGGTVALGFGLLPVLNIFGAFLGGAVAAYEGEYSMSKGTGTGFAVGLISLVPLGAVTTLGVLVTSAGGALDIPGLSVLGSITGIFSGIIGAITLLFAPLAGALGGFWLGFHIHLIQKVSNCSETGSVFQG